MHSGKIARHYSVLKSGKVTYLISFIWALTFYDIDDYFFVSKYKLRNIRTQESSSLNPMLSKSHSALGLDGSQLAQKRGKK